MPKLNIQKAKEKGYTDEQIRVLQKRLEAEYTQPPTAPQQQAEAKHAGPLDRFLLSFGDSQGREQYLEKKGIEEENVNKPGLDLGDITSKAGGLLPAGLGTAGFIGGAGLAGLLGLPSGPGAVATGFAGGVAGGAAGEVAGERYRQALGDVLGVRKNDNLKEDNKALGDAAKFGAVSSALGPVLGKAGKAALGGTSEKAIQRALRPAAGTLTKYRKQGINLLKEWVELGVRGTPDQIKSQASKIAESSKTYVDDLIEKSGLSAPVDEVVDSLMSNVIEYGGRAARTGNKAKENALLEVAQAAEASLRAAAKGGKVPLKEVNRIKSEFQKEIGEKFGSEAGIVEGQKKVQNALKLVVEKYLPDVKAGNRKTQVAQELIETINKVGEKSAKSLTDTILSASPRYTGFAAGGYLGNMLGGVPGGLAGGAAGGFIGDTLQKAITSVPSRTIRGQALKQLERVPGPDGAATNFIMNLLRGQ